MIPQFSGTSPQDVEHDPRISGGWQQVARIALSGTSRSLGFSGDAANTYHPQGMKIIGHRLYMTTADQTNSRALLLDFDIDIQRQQATLAAQVVLNETDKRRAYTHPGGICVSDGRLLVPLAADRQHGPCILLGVDRTDPGGVEEIGALADHCGAVLCEAGSQVVRLFDWSTGVYTVELTKQGQLWSGIPFRPDPDADSGTGIPYGGYEYQDCKGLGNSYFACAGKVGPRLASLLPPKVLFGGVVDLIRFNSTSPGSSYRVEHRIRVPLVYPTGETTFSVPMWRLLAMDGHIRTPPLSFNPFDVTQLPSEDGGATLRFFFAPHDHPDTHLFVYDVSNDGMITQ